MGCTGYDLTRLLIGSEGTLAVITEATLKLHAIPAHKLALRVAFKDLLSASTMARDTLNCGVIIGRCELLDPEMVRIMNEANVGDDVWEEAPTLLYEITGHSEANVRVRKEETYTMDRVFEITIVLLCSPAGLV